MKSDYSEELSRRRQNLNFPHAVLLHFDFLRDYGFAVQDSDPTNSLGSLIRLVDPDHGDRYRHYAARTAEDVVVGVQRSADLLKQYGDKALRGDAVTFATLAEQSTALAKAYSLETKALQIRPKADAAFKRGAYNEAAALYEQIRPSLTATELKKLAFAKQRAGQ
jgi:hypothetical protein